ncbi:MFS transporter [Saccharothrix syringae]|uniref:MFS transporter n=1 Tax=Saccharothrix syringae TaxID=103733 RepID=A0A5Q0GUG1_SACSY|nr:MFS transporter [Saccharothrix syringae]QFZ17736.1 MFS transporter [Saccharothrix syringae]
MAEVLTPAGKRSWPFYVAGFVDSVGSGLFLPVSMLYFIRVVGLPEWQVGTFIALSSVIALVVPALVGSLIDRVGPLRIIVIGQVLQAVGTAGYLLVGSPFGVLVVTMLCAVGQRVFWSCFFGLGAQLAGDGPKEKWFSVASTMQAGGAGIGGLLAALLFVSDTAASYVLLIVLNAASFAVSAALLLVIRVGKTGTSLDTGDGVSGNGGYRLVLRDRRYLLIVVLGTVLAIPSTFFASGLPVYLTQELDAPSWISGGLLTTVTVLMVALQMLAVRVVRGVRHTTTLAICAFLWTAWAIAMAVASTVDDSVLVAFLFAVTGFYIVADLLHGPIVNALVEEIAPGGMKGRYLAFFQYSYNFAAVLSPLLVAAFAWGPALPWGIFAALSGASGLLFLMLNVGGRRARKP